jgi:Zn ribbon nucleic-acid-binding protein
VLMFPINVGVNLVVCVSCGHQSCTCVSEYVGQ